MNSGLCECGCGQATKLALYSRRSTGLVKGEPRRFLHGHNAQRAAPAVRIAAQSVLRDMGYDTPCSVFSGYVAKDGYGRISIGRFAPSYTHVVAWEVANGIPVPKGHELHHLCKTRACTNPEHLLPVTPAEHRRFHPPPELTHCKNGHEYTLENTVPRWLADRTHPHRCLTCTRAASSRGNARRRTAA